MSESEGEPIQGKVATIIDRYTVVLNVGAKKGVVLGRRFKIVSSAIQVTDPNTKSNLGSFQMTKAVVKVSAVYDNFSVAKTEEEQQTVFTSGMPSLFSSSRSSSTVQKELPLPEIIATYSMNVSVGDDVVELRRQ